uniref:Uncharacterized protein n=1 Tax=Peronospora matthiolae TaxID=2874970 RepID=A0AAV1TPJ5_9STRA
MESAKRREWERVMVEEGAALQDNNVWRVTRVGHERATHQVGVQDEEGRLRDPGAAHGLASCLQQRANLWYRQQLDVCGSNGLVDCQGHPRARGHVGVPVKHGGIP